jgi:hypothetical protein
MGKIVSVRLLKRGVDPLPGGPTVFSRRESVARGESSSSETDASSTPEPSLPPMDSPEFDAIMRQAMQEHLSSRAASRKTPPSSGSNGSSGTPSQHDAEVGRAVEPKAVAQAPLESSEFHEMMRSHLSNLGSSRKKNRNSGGSGSNEVP